MNSALKRSTEPKVAAAELKMQLVPTMQHNPNRAAYDVTNERDEADEHEEASSFRSICAQTAQFWSATRRLPAHSSCSSPAAAAKKLQDHDVDHTVTNSRTNSQRSSWVRHGRRQLWQQPRPPTTTASHRFGLPQETATTTSNNKRCTCKIFFARDSSAHARVATRRPCRELHGCDALCSSRWTPTLRSRL